MMQITQSDPLHVPQGPLGRSKVKYAIAQAVTKEISRRLNIGGVSESTRASSEMPPIARHFTRSLAQFPGQSSGCEILYELLCPDSFHLFLLYLSLDSIVGISITYITK
jgi:hypothetical protein